MIKKTVCLVILFISLLSLLTSASLIMTYKNILCDSDMDCKAPNICISESTDSKIKSINTKTDDLIENALSKNKKGECALIENRITIDDEIIYAPLTNLIGTAASDVSVEIVTTTNVTIQETVTTTENISTVVETTPEVIPLSENTNEIVEINTTSTKFVLPSFDINLVLIFVGGLVFVLFISCIALITINSFKILNILKRILHKTDDPEDKVDKYINKISNFVSNKPVNKSKKRRKKKVKQLPY